MQVTIDLNDILTDGEGYSQETLQESVRRQVITQMTETLKKGIQTQVNAEISKVISDEIQSAVKSQMPTIVEDLMNAEYVKVDKWGDRQQGATTFRKELVASIHDQMVYKKASYDSDKNAFTRAVDEVVRESMKEFQSAFRKQVDANFVSEAITHATTELRQKLGIPK